MLDPTFKFAQCVDHLFEQSADRVGSEEKKNKCDDFESITPKSLSLRDGQSTTFLFGHFPGES